MIFVVIALRRIEWRVYDRFFRIILLKSLILKGLLLRISSHSRLDIKILEFRKHSLRWVLLVIWLLLEQVLDDALLNIFLLILNLELIFFGVKIVLSEDKVTVCNDSRILRYLIYMSFAVLSLVINIHASCRHLTPVCSISGFDIPESLLFYFLQSI